MLAPGKQKLALELAAKVRGYFTNRYGEVADFNSIPAKMDGDRDLYELASKLTKKVVQPGGTKNADEKAVAASKSKAEESR